jgi:hypothetical protein
MNEHGYSWRDYLHLHGTRRHEDAAARARKAAQDMAALRMAIYEAQRAIMAMNAEPWVIHRAAAPGELHARPLTRAELMSA